MVVSLIPQPRGMVYALIAIPVIIFLYRTGRFTTPVRLALLILSTLFGFLIFAPIAPCLFQQVPLGEVRQLGIPLEMALFFPILFNVVTSLAGRSYCSSVCPRGAIQNVKRFIRSERQRKKAKNRSVFSVDNAQKSVR